MTKKRPRNFAQKGVGPSENCHFYGERRKKRHVRSQVNCITDFGGKNSTFLGYSERVTGAAATIDGSTSVEDWMAQEVNYE